MFGTPDVLARVSRGVERHVFMKHTVMSSARRDILAALSSGNVPEAGRRLQELSSLLGAALWQDVEAVQLLAAYRILSGQAGLAIALIGRLLQKKASPEADSLPEWPKTAEARLYQTLGRAFLIEGKVEAARMAFARAVALFPEEAAGQAGLAEALTSLGHYDEALPLLKKARQLAPEEPALLLFLAQLYHRLGQVQPAIESYRAVLRHAPENELAHANLGAMLFATGELDEAETCLRTALACGDSTSRTLGSFAQIRLGQGFVAEAQNLLARVVGQTPEDAALWLSYGTALYEAACYDEAKAAFGQAEAYAGQDRHISAQACFNRAAIFLARGDWHRGWQGFEQRRVFMPDLTPVIWRDLPLWDGQEGRSPVGIYAEQGLGDAVQFLRYLPEAVRRRPVCFYGPPSLERLIRDFMKFPPERFFLAGESGAGPVMQQSLLSLPVCLAKTGEGGCDEWQQAVPYLSTGGTIVRSPGQKIRIGLCWAGNPSYAFDRCRSVSLEQLTSWLAPLAQSLPVQFVNLQNTGPVSWMENPVLEWLDDLAEAILSCDLVVSVDTLTAHMTGALGRKLWLLNRYGGDWRWQGVTWYHDVCQFRPPALMPPYEGWESVLAEVSSALKLFAQEKERRETDL